MKRRTFFNKSLLAASGITLFPEVVVSAKENMDVALVKDFVISCHGNFEDVRKLYKEEPLLIFSSFDWGNGNYENGIEAAGHMGNREIADYLISKGSRMNFFTFCMLGKLVVIKNILKEFPVMLNAPGVHGFTALHHANQGGKEAEDVKNYLLSLGAEETKINLWDPPSGN